jgi:hypothetical protein
MIHPSRVVSSHNKVFVRQQSLIKRMLSGNKQAPANAAANADSKRLSANSEIFGPDLVENHPDIIKLHLLARNVDVNSELFGHLDKISGLCDQRRNARKNKNIGGTLRKELSDKIGPMVKANRPEDKLTIEKLKQEAHEAAILVESSTKEAERLYEEVDGLLNSFPNLLDDRLCFPRLVTCGCSTVECFLEYHMAVVTVIMSKYDHGEVKRLSREITLGMMTSRTHWAAWITRQL